MSSISRYDGILELAKSEYLGYKDSANKWIPKAYEALKEEAGENFEPKEAADRIKKDFVAFYSLDWIRRNLPAEAKDEVKSEAGKEENRKKRKPAGEIPQKPAEILVTAGGSTEPATSENPNETESFDKPSVTVTDPVPQELRELPQLPSPDSMQIKQLQATVTNLENEKTEMMTEIEKLAKAISSVAADAKRSPVYRELADQKKTLEKENEELRTALQSNSQLTSAKQQEGSRVVLVLKQAKLGEAFIVIRKALDAKRDVEIVADAAKEVAFLRGVGSK